jgi:dihydroxyacetone kinase
MLKDRGIRVHRAFVGEYATSMEMSGASVSLIRLDDDRTKLLDAPAYSPFLLHQVGALPKARASRPAPRRR